MRRAKRIKQSKLDAATYGFCLGDVVECLDPETQVGKFGVQFRLEGVGVANGCAIGYFVPVGSKLADHNGFRSMLYDGFWKSHRLVSRVLLDQAVSGVITYDELAPEQSNAE